MTTGAFSWNVGKLFPKLKLVTDNLSLFMQQPTEKPLKIYQHAMYIWLLRLTHTRIAK